VSIRLRFIAITLLAIALFGVGCSSQSSAERDFQALVSKVEKVNIDLRKKQTNLMESVRKFNQKYPQMQLDSLAQTAYGLSADEAKVLGERVAQEKDISTKGLLSEIVSLNAQVQDMKKQMDEMSKQLAPPHVVTRGESHYQICLDYLTNEAGFSLDSARATLEKVAQFDELMPGFFVWHFLDKKSGLYLTTVTQGEAKISPNQLHRATKRKLEQERTALVQAKSDLEAQVADLEQRKATLLGQIESIGKERDQAKNEVKVVTSEKVALTAEKEKLTAKLNSVYYTVGSIDNLKSRGVLRRPFLGRVKGSDLSKAQYDHWMDVSHSTNLTITASSVGLSQISDVIIYPEEAFKSGSDYKVKVEGATATITLLRPDRFKGANIVIGAK